MLHWCICIDVWKSLSFWRTLYMMCRLRRPHNICNDYSSNLFTINKQRKRYHLSLLAWSLQTLQVVMMSLKTFLCSAVEFKNLTICWMLICVALMIRISGQASRTCVCAACTQIPGQDTLYVHNQIISSPFLLIKLKLDCLSATVNKENYSWMLVSVSCLLFMSYQDKYKTFWSEFLASSLRQ